ncbi:MAG: methyl-accepting chemotaxis protein [Phenylobacterium sp.]|jgi:methyl-accepting chemotaxis protein
MNNNEENQVSNWRSAFGNSGLAKKLSIGFGTVIVLIAALVAFIEIKMLDQEELQNQIIDLRMPTNLAGHDLVNDINWSLASLRGYMLLGKTELKEQRAEAWKEMDKNLAILDKMAQNWTVPADVERLREIKTTMGEFKIAQQKVEDVANTPDEQPGLKILINDAAPLATKIMANLTELMNLEKNQPATSERKTLLSNLADSRGSFAMSLASIRALLLSGDTKWENDFEGFWDKNITALNALNRQSQLFSAAQRRAFQNYVDSRREFADLPEKMFSIRASEQWNTANYILSKEAAPKAKKLLYMLKEMVKGQGDLVEQDSKQLKSVSSSLRTTSLVITALAIIIAIFVARLITKAIVRPLTRAKEVADAVSAGNLNNPVERTFKDETGQLLNAIFKMQETLQQQAIVNNDYSAQIEAIGKAQAVIEFNMDGTIRTANANFLATMGYTAAELENQHHSMFAESAVTSSDEYRQFWEQLNRGEYQQGEFQRIDKQGNEVWLQAAYNPILDLDGKAFKVVKFASDITAQKQQAVESKKTAEISNALKLCNANVMLADNELTIVYMNNGIEKMLKGREQTLRQDLPAFNASTLIGTSADIFHKNAAHQRDIVSKTDTTSTSRIKVAGLTFDLTLSPWMNNEGERLGTVVEWYDVTDELAAQETERAVAAANSRVKVALDKCQANVMMADNDLNIIYMNASVEAMMRRNETELRTVLPTFSADKLVGTCVDDFHVNPAHQRAMISQLTSSYNTKLKLGTLTFELMATPIFDETNNRLGTVVEWSDITEQLATQLEERRISDENARIKLALDSVGSNTMIADAGNNIIYMNQAVQDMMSTAERDIQQALPNFDAANLIGQSVDNFHANPAHQQGLLARLESRYTTEINVGVRTFSLIANPIKSEEGERIGTVVEWGDRTEEVAIEKEIADLISGAGAGDLSNRIDEAGKSGFFLNLAGGLNQLVGIAEGVIDETASMLDAMAHGNLTNRIESDYEGAYDKLKTDANGTAEKLTEIIGRINNSSAAVASGAEEIAQGNTDLSQRTEEQASSLEETASSMEQMTATVRQNADNAKVANELAADATTKAQKGGEVVRRAVNSMAEINDSSKKIADIIGVIDEIAFQTNLLALNAAVEAARAGEQGRGFAVVAGEVRNLAQRSAAAAKEIKDLIRDSVSKVQDGSQLVNESGATLSEIVDAISKVTTMIGEISIASNEQSEGIEQVNKAITQMDEMTQQNAALVEEASAAGEAMADQARGMRQILGFFTTEQGGVPAVQSSRQVAPAPAARRPAAVAPPAPTQVASSDVDFADDDEEWEEF